MKCTIIQDLLPLYCDGLTSSDSNEEIEKHLADCDNCREVYENMKTKEMNIDIPERDIEPLKTVKKRTRIKIIGAVLGTAAVLFGLFMLIFWGIIPITSDKVHYIVEAHESEVENKYCDDDIDAPDAVIRTETVKVNRLWLKFKSDKSCCRYSTKPKMVLNEDGSITTNQQLYIYPQIKLPFDNRGKHPNQFDLGFDVHEGDTLTIHYRDKTEVIDVYQMFTENKK